MFANKNVGDQKNDSISFAHMYVQTRTIHLVLIFSYLQTGSSEGAGFFFFGRISFQAGIFSGGGGGSRGQERVCEIQTG